jgi:hypothetical protein
LKTGSAVNQVTPMLIMHSLASRLEPGYSCSKSGATWMGVGWGTASEACSITDLPGNYFSAYSFDQGRVKDLSTMAMSVGSNDVGCAWPPTCRLLRASSARGTLRIAPSVAS